MKLLSGIAVLAVITAGAATPSFATTITPGTTVVPNQTVLTGFTSLASENIPYSNTSTSGTDAGQVGASVGTWAGNPFGANDMTFVYQVYVSSGDVQHVSLTNFGDGTYTIDVAQAPFNASVPGCTSNSSCGTSPAYSADFNSLGVLEFNFPDSVIGSTSTYQLNSGDLSELLIVNTDATSFTAGNISLIDGSTTTIAGYQPTDSPAPAPEPSTLSLLGTGLLAAGAGLRRRMLKK